MCLCCKVYAGARQEGLRLQPWPILSTLTHTCTLSFCLTTRAGPAERRERVAALVAAVGFGPVWVGNLRHARNLEALAELYIHLGAGIEGPDWSAPDGTRPYHFQVLRGGGSGESQG